MASDRFFAATITSGWLHILGLPQGGPWNREQLEWREEPELDILVNPRAGDRKVVTREALEAIVQAPAEATLTRFLWIHESLLEEAWRLWTRDVRGTS